jgi:hypothetical protein
VPLDLLEFASGSACGGQTTLTYVVMCFVFYFPPENNNRSKKNLIKQTLANNKSRVIMF